MGESLTKIVADNGKYLCRVTVEFEDDEGGNEKYIAETIQASKRTPDASCVFKVESRPGNPVVLKADNGKFLCREDHEEDFQPIEAHWSWPDAACHFKFLKQSDSTVVLQADNGKYLSRARREGIDLIIANKDTIDATCKFIWQR